MATFHFDLVSPEKLLFSGEVDQVDVPGSEGEFGVLAEHAPVVAMLDPGILTVYAGGETQRYVVLGGFAEVSHSGLTILADLASSVEEIDHAMLQTRIEELEESVGKMEPGSVLDREITRLDRFKTVHRHLQGTAMH